ncbi:hypothetical protein [Halostreptopolyspora alba]|uniref:Uncharacterized protein n=1 Tax=Halostreptopolyspora alba TaxID=2487137 RepID=A0A3N0ED97_9ACTN|nr:hypothetical protein EFW17_07685 [Nocardiopsaceae bacterium YIM 96095]
MSERDATQLSPQFGLSMLPRTNREDVHAHGERVMQELLKLERCNSDFSDSAVSTDAEQSTITVDLLIFGLVEPTAVLERALAIIRTAAHAAGGATPVWPSVVSDQPDQVRMEKTYDLTPA